MVEGTLSTWMIIATLGGLSLLLFGYFNYYIPKEQKIKAKTQANYEHFSEDCFIEYDTRVNEIWYFVLAALLMIIILGLLVFDNWRGIYPNLENYGFLGVIIGILLLIVGFVAGSVLLVHLAYLGQEMAAHDAKKHYWREFSVIICPPQK